MKSISTKRGVGGRVLLPREGREKNSLRREGWEVVVIVNTTG